MSLNEIGVIVFGLFAGYWVVGKLFFPSRPTPPSTPRVAAASAPSRAWNDVLQVPPDAPVESIREAYRHLISQYHPDKVESLGQELKDLAAPKASEINQAYRTALELRGLDA